MAIQQHLVREQLYQTLAFPYTSLAGWKPLGKDSSGTVYRCRIQDLFLSVAVKVPNAEERGSGQEIERECELLKDLRHPNIVLFLGTTVNPKGALCIITEFLTGGSLSSWLHDDAGKKERLTASVKLRVTVHVALGLRYLHSRRIIHRNVKPANCLTSFDCSAVKLTDMGCAQLIDSADSTGKFGTTGTVVYMAPEMHRDEAYGVPVDVFSYGVLLWELYSGERPFKGVKMQDLIRDVGFHGLRPTPMPESMPADLRATVEGCWKTTPKERLTMVAILEALEKLSRKEAQKESAEEDD